MTTSLAEAIDSALVFADGDWIETYKAELAHALQAIKPAFNEEMRAGMTNM